MTRTTDDLHPEPPFKPFGEKVTPPAPLPAPEWKPVRGRPGFEVNSSGQWRTMERKT